MSIPGSASPLLLASTAAAGGYQVSRSLRFNAPDTAFLNRTPAVAGNRKTWTWAGWVKRCQFGTYEHIFNGTGSSPSYAQFYWSPTEQLVFDNGGSGAITTTQVFRDPSAWYHIVLTFDTTQGTAADRMRMYANGQQITTFSSSSYPTQNSDGGMNQASAHFIGKDSSFAGFYLADIHFIDGQALTPSSFTEVSATTGQLVPIAYTGTYGTNGFQLKFADNSAATAATLGADTSGNGNNWTPNNFSVVSGTGVVTTPASNAPPTVDYLVVAGGGGGSRGGGGAGGLRSTVTATGGGGTLESPLTVNAGTSYTVTVGAGGAGDPSAGSIGTNGANSVFSTITSIGGGGAAQGTTSPLSGGSGGGAETGGISGAAGTANQGFAGGDGFGSGGTRGSGGGGGAGAVGVNGASAAGGAGGAGVACSITGSSVTYGGGGGTHGISSAGAGGTGGGGAGAVSGPGGAGSANTGGGGGGGGNEGGAGGSGIVFLRYANTYDDLIVGAGLTYTYANTGGYKIYSFTASATAAQSAGNDSLVDTPTSYGTDTGVGGEVRGNYCTWNPLDKAANTTLANGNLDCTWTASSGGMKGTIGISSGKWYWEITVGANTSVGLIKSSVGQANSWPGDSVYGSGGSYGYAPDGQKVTNSSYSAYGTAHVNGDVVGVAYDATNGKLFFSRNGTWQASGDPAAGTNAAYTSITGEFSPGLGYWTTPTTNVNSANFGQRAFAYTAPSGFKALCDTNLGAPLVAKPNTVMDVVLWTGNNSSPRAITGLGFNPDFVWIKERNASTYYHRLFDSVRGTSNSLYLPGTEAENTYSSGYANVSSFDSSGFTLTDTNGGNNSAVTYVGWTWDAGTSTVSNTAGSITSQVRANVSAGFSVVTYTGNGVNATVGHGLGVAPQFVIVKGRSTSYDWVCWHQALAATSYIALNATAAAYGGVPNVWNSTIPSSTVFSIGTALGVNTSSSGYVAYCFAPVVGYSNGFSYTGNGSADGSFVYLGFRPRLIMLKRSDSTSNWTLLDTSREGYNVDNDPLYPNLSDAEGTTDLLDITSNGFKLRSTDASVNASAGTYIGFAWAEAPFAYSRAR